MTLQAINDQVATWRHLIVAYISNINLINQMNVEAKTKYTLE